MDEAFIPIYLKQYTLCVLGIREYFLQQLDRCLVMLERMDELVALAREMIKCFKHERELYYEKTHSVAQVAEFAPLVEDLILEIEEAEESQQTKMNNILMASKNNYALLNN